MNTRNQNKIKAVVTLAAVAIAVFAGLAQAQTYPYGEIGILTPEVLNGNNPATGEPWADGDTYRFVFFTSGKTTAVSADLSTYNEWVQGLANATTVYDIGADEGVTWNVIGSTVDANALDNTSTHWTDEEPGSPIFLLDGSTIIANDYKDLWDGEIQHIIDLTEQGTLSTYWPFTGTKLDGTVTSGFHGPLGNTGSESSQGNSSITTQWVWRVNTAAPKTQELQMYAMSDPLVITGDPALPDVVAGDDWLTWSSQEVTLDTTVTNNDPDEPQSDLIYAWSADAASSADTNLTITITPNVDPADATVLITKTAPTGDATVVKITLAVTLPGKNPVKAHMTIDVYDDACKAAVAIGQATIDPGDFNANCKTSFEDIAMMAIEWFLDYSITAPIAKP
jgi:hypothetical protein